MCTALTFQTLCVHLMSCNLNTTSIPESSKTSMTLGCAHQHQFRCRQYHWWCMWVWRHACSAVCICCVDIGLSVFLCLDQGRELLACAPTGSGKTLAFCVPLLAHLQQPANLGFRAVIISPTRELASQVHNTSLYLWLEVIFQCEFIPANTRLYSEHLWRILTVIMININFIIFVFELCLNNQIFKYNICYFSLDLQRAAASNRWHRF